ncbi:MAG: selenide, water dikinase SelD [Acidobacteria bacterium]|nr:MAG: selenide, water dikinase SelD [Acidobacteriota bacterium]
MVVASRATARPVRLSAASDPWQPGSPPLRRLVLVGGGHTHVQVLRDFMMRGLPERTEVTVVLDRPVAIYSGMVPGLLAGDYTAGELEIDVRPLARRAGCRVIGHACTAVDPVARRIALHGRPAIAYDVASLDVGSTVAQRDLPGVARHCVPTRPIADLVERYEQVLVRCREIAAERPPRIVVVGAGAGGIEIAFSVEARLRRDTGLAPHVTVVHAAQRVLAGAAAGLARRIERRAATRGIELLARRRVCSVDADAVHLEDGESLPADAVFWVTGAAPHGFLREAPLRGDDNGFVLVRDTLQAVQHDDLFAVGDCASLASGAPPKAGVYAVRQGPVLVDNLRRWLAGERLREYQPQSDFLTLLNLGDGTAVGSKWGVQAEGRAVLRLKDWIDRRFMRRFQLLSPQGEELPGFAMRDEGPAMACGGCAAKVEQDALGEALDRLADELPVPPARGNRLLRGRDDVATYALTEGVGLVLNVDGFRAFVDDPWLVGRCAALNALSDLWAKAASPRCAQAWITVPQQLSPELAGEMLFQVLAGARSALDEAGVELVGGHSTTGPELQVGFAIDGVPAETEPRLLLAQAELQAGDRLILTGRLGTGVLLHADMMGRAPGPWVETALAAMQSDRAAIGQLARELGARGATDVTGFGLAGHLATLAAPSGGQGSPPVRPRLELSKLPALDGAAELLRQGLRSTAHSLNRGRITELALSPGAETHPLFELLFDPQTCGGLLIAAPPAAASALLARYAEVGIEARGIGEVVVHDGRDHHRIEVTVGSPAQSEETVR